MKHSLLSATTLLFLVTIVAFTVMFACNNSEAKNDDTPNAYLPAKKLVEPKALIERGDYLVNTVGGCGDCHSPKVFTAQGWEFDKSKYMSGHPADSPLPSLSGVDPFKPGNWILFSPDLTSVVGPWGLTFSANLTPHASGIGSWKEENFIKALRTGKHMGVDDGRPIMPPMPWQTIGQMTDEDLKAIFTYLKTLPPIDNLVPAPMSPDDARKMLK